MFLKAGSWLDAANCNRATCFGDQYKATDFLVPGKGNLEVKWISKDGKDIKKFKVFDFPGSGTALTMYNLDDSIKDFLQELA